MPKFDDYKNRYKHIRMERRDAILQIIFHTEGGPLKWSMAAHRLLSRPRVRIHLAPPTSLSIIGHFRELRKIRACARDLPSHADPERDVVDANRPNFANPLCARFPYVRPHAIGGVPIGGSERSGAGLSLFFRLRRVPNTLPIRPRQSNVC